MPIVGAEDMTLTVTADDDGPVSVTIVETAPDQYEAAVEFWSATLTASGDEPPVVPEPSTLVLLAVGMAAMLLWRRRS